MRLNWELQEQVAIRRMPGDLGCYHYLKGLQIRATLAKEPRSESSRSYLRKRQTKRERERKEFKVPCLQQSYASRILHLLHQRQAVVGIWI